MPSLPDLQGLASLDAPEVDAQVLPQLADTDLSRAISHVAHGSTSIPEDKGAFVSLGDFEKRRTTLNLARRLEPLSYEVTVGPKAAWKTWLS